MYSTFQYTPQNQTRSLLYSIPEVIGSTSLTILMCLMAYSWWKAVVDFTPFFLTAMGINFPSDELKEYLYTIVVFINRNCITVVISAITLITLHYFAQQKKLTNTMVTTF